jgi:hypothetical protein
MVKAEQALSIMRIEGQQRSAHRLNRHAEFLSVGGA